MNPEQQLVLGFHSITGALINFKPTQLSQKEANLRANLITEEAYEFELATATQDLVAIADALGDLLYVVYGAGVGYGIDLEPVFREIHRSNLTKVWPCEICGGTPGLKCDKCEGAGFIVRVREEDSKILKPPTFEPPDLMPLLKEQGYELLPVTTLSPEEIKRILHSK